MIDPSQMRNSSAGWVIRLAIPGVLAVIGLVCLASGAAFEGEILLFIAAVRLVLVLVLRNRYGQNGGSAFMIQQRQFGQSLNGQAPYGQAPYGQAPYGQGPYGQAPMPGQAPYGQAPMAAPPVYGQAPTPPPPFGSSSN